jgi:Glyoxalase-like domain
LCPTATAGKRHAYCWGVLSGPRLRQVALVAHDCAQVAGQLHQAFGWPPPFHDPGVGQFGLTNAVFAAGDTFVEVVAPAQPGTTAGRYLERRGGDGGYMAIFQVPDLAAARRRVASLGVRVVWTADLPDIAATHLHPGDLPGAIVSLDWAAPEQSWRWAGPSWTGRVPDHAPGGVTALTIEVSDPPAASRRWAAVLGISAADSGDTIVVELPDQGQRLRFVPARGGRGEGITEMTIAGLRVKGAGDVGEGPWVIGGVRFAGEEE